MLPGFAHWFRYPLHRHDFHPLRTDDDAGRLLGYYAAKPLPGNLDARGRVDRNLGFNGRIVAVFVPSPARSWRHARLIHGCMPAGRVQLADGRRNWPAIRRAAETSNRRGL